MTENLLQAPEREVIETFLQRIDAEDGARPSYERLLGFLTGVVITPGRFLPSDWMQPLLDMNDIVFDDIDDANRFIQALMPLYNRINSVRLRDENLCPFELEAAATSDETRKVITDWAEGLHGALTLRPEIWAAEGKDARHVPADLREEMAAVIPFLWALAEPVSIPEIVPDPMPFQRNLLSKSPEWTEDMFSNTWDDELLDLFGIVCLGQLGMITDALQRYAKAYDRAPIAQRFQEPIVGARTKVGRNEPCPCGSGKKFKKCCGA